MLLNLGREDELDVEGLRLLARSITRYTDGEPPDAAEVAGEGLEVVSSRRFGGAFVLDALWRRLGAAEAIARALGVRRYQTDVERVLFALVTNRVQSSRRLGSEGRPLRESSPFAETWISSEVWIS